MEKAEFLQEGAVPFALASCERFISQPVTGHYDEKQQVWQGDKELSINLFPTATATRTPGDYDRDRD